MSVGATGGSAGAGHIVERNESIRFHTTAFVRDQEINSARAHRLLRRGDGLSDSCDARYTIRRENRRARAAHILVISDDGVSTHVSTPMSVASRAGRSRRWPSAQRCGGGGTLVLNLPDQWDTVKGGPYADIRRARDEQGWYVHRVASLEELVEFARQFSRFALRQGQRSRLFRQDLQG